jgi:phage recombination protein Bet
MTTALEKAEARDKEIVVAGMTRTQIDVIKRTIAKDLSDDELRLFLYQAERSGLDPLARQIYAFKSGGRVSIAAYIDGLRLLADRTGHYVPGRPTTFQLTPEGQPDSATAYVMKWVPAAGEWFEIEETAYFDEQNRNTPPWRDMPRTMLAKCAEAKALRRAFPANLSGLKEESELPSLQAAVPMQYETPVTSTPALTPEQQARLQAPALPPHPEPVSEPVVQTEPPAAQPDPDPAPVFPPAAQEPSTPPRRTRRTRCKACGELKTDVKSGQCPECRAAVAPEIGDGPPAGDHGERDTMCSRCGAGPFWPAQMVSTGTGLICGDCSLKSSPTTCIAGCGATVEVEGGKCPECALKAAAKPPAKPGSPDGPEPSERVLDAIKRGLSEGRFTQAEAMAALKADPDVADDHEQWSHAHADAAVRLLDGMDNREG